MVSCHHRTNEKDTCRSRSTKECSGTHPAGGTHLQDLQKMGTTCTACPGRTLYYLVLSSCVKSIVFVDAFVGRPMTTAGLDPCDDACDLVHQARAVLGPCVLGPTFSAYSVKCKTNMQHAVRIPRATSSKHERSRLFLSECDGILLNRAL